MSKMVNAIALVSAVAGLGITALPLSSYAVGDNPAKVGFQATVDNNISISASGNNFSESSGQLTLGTLLAGGDISTSSVTVVVTTSNKKGCTLMIRSATSDTSMRRLDESGAIATGDGAAEIPATSDNLAAGASGWGYSVNSSQDYTGITSSATTIGSTANNSQASITINFGARAAADQKSGNYRSQIIVTAAINND